MAKLRSPSPSQSASTASSLSTSPPAAAHFSMQLKQDLALLADSDPDTRRSSMEALRQFIEGQLDAQSMAGFLEQVSGETGKSSGGYAISLFTEVARVHKAATVPFIPRIMAAVLRTLASSSGWANHANNLHQACAKVVASVAKYTIEPASRSSATATDVLDSLCQPLLVLLYSNVEPVAVGSATCLQAIVDAENWKLAAPELVHDVCSRSSISVIDKGKRSVAHLHLLRSLAKFSAEVLQEYAASILKVGIHVLVARGGSASGCGSWQQRAAFAQLLGTIIGSSDHRFLASDLIPTINALEKCRLDKMASVRQAVVEALSVAKSIVSEVDPLLLHDDGSEINLAYSSPSKNRVPEPQKRAVPKRNISRAESCGSTITGNSLAESSHGSHIVSNLSSSSSSTTSTLRSPAISPSEKSTARMGRTPLYPEKELQVGLSCPVDKHVAEADFTHISAHARSSEFKGNAPLATKAEGDRLGLSKSDDLRYLLVSNESKVSNESQGDELAVDATKDYLGVSDLHFDRVTLENHTELDAFNIDSCKEKKYEMKKSEKLFEVSEDLGCKPDEQRFADGFCNAETENVPEHVKMVVENHGTVSEWKKKMPPGCEDFLIFSTPRRLVRSLQSLSSTPESKFSPVKDQGLDLDYETLSESGWSVRDNPIAGDNEQYSPRQFSARGQRDMLTTSMEGPFKGLFCDSGLPEESSVRCSESSSGNNSLPANSTNDHLHNAMYGRHEVFNGYAERPANEELLSKHQDSFNKSHNKEPFFGLSKSTAESQFVYLLKKVNWYVESLLISILILVLAFVILVAILSCQGQHETHGLVPT